MRFLLDNAMKDEKDIVIDLGYAKDAEERFNKLRAFGIGKKNFRIELNDRLVLKCPKGKFESLMKSLPIVAGGSYWQTTHRWEGVA
jgi:hypothetical protein